MLSKCTCKSEYQDKKYGKGNRVFNQTGGGRGGGNGVARCAVCGHVLQNTIGVVNQKVKSNVV